MKLVIVESPAKARTIEKFLGPEFKVVASYGHVRDLPSSAAEIPKALRQQPWARMGVDVDAGFNPLYVVTAESRRQVAELKKLVKQADELLLATDQDREGEAISWHLVEILQPSIPVRRITFHEITKEAIERAVAAPGEVNTQLVRAQESRRILDRLYGYSLSPVLWKKVRTKLSAGRVQSVAVRLVVEREEERQAFRVCTYWDVEAHLDSPEGRFTARLHRIGDRRLAAGKDFDATTGALKAEAGRLLLTAEQAARIARGCLDVVPWRVGRVQSTEQKQHPRPPFTTSTLQQAASSVLGLTPKRTMMVAQRLYEGLDAPGAPDEGLITYMRTDSLTLAERALAQAEQLIRRTWGDEYTAGPRRYRTQAKGAQEAHEAIRPTDLSRTPEDVSRYLSGDELRLYRLIWNRAIASQMADAVVDRTTADLRAVVDGEEHVFRAAGSVVRFPGFLAVIGVDRSETRLPLLSEGQEIRGLPNPAAGPPDTAEGVRVVGAEPKRHETAPPPRYTEATLVRKLEEEGIGRPSTYAPTISTIQNRGYVLKKSGALVPSYIGLAVTHLLRRHFPRYIDLRFTARMEEDLDSIAAGEVEWRDFLRAFYHGEGEEAPGLRSCIEKELPQIGYPAIPLGEDPDSAAPLTVRIGRTYVYVQRGAGEDADRATLPVDLLIDELTPAKALQLIEAGARASEPLGRDPRTDQNVYVRVGPYGPYVQLGEATEGNKPRRVSLLRGTPVETVTLDEALRLLQLPRSLGADPQTGQEVTAGIGRFGPYIARAGIYVSLKDPQELFSIGLAEAVERIEAKNRKTVLKDLGAHPQTGQPLQVLKGRWGPYVTDGQHNANLGRNADLESFTVQQALPLLEAAAQRQQDGDGKRRRKTAAKPAASRRAAKGDSPRPKAASGPGATKKATRRKPAVKKAVAKKLRRSPAK